MGKPGWGHQIWCILTIFPFADVTDRVRGQYGPCFRVPKPHEGHVCVTLSLSEVSQGSQITLASLAPSWFPHRSLPLPSSSNSSGKPNLSGSLWLRGEVMSQEDTWILCQTARLEVRSALLPTLPSWHCRPWEAEDGGQWLGSCHSQGEQDWVLDYCFYCVLALAIVDNWDWSNRWEHWPYFFLSQLFEFIKRKNKKTSIKMKTQSH